MAGAGAGVFLAQSSALPPDFLITGNFSLSQVINYYLVIRIRWWSGAWWLESRRTKVFFLVAEFQSGDKRCNLLRYRSGHQSWRQWAKLLVTVGKGLSSYNFNLAQKLTNSRFVEGKSAFSFTLIEKFCLVKSCDTIITHRVSPRVNYGNLRRPASAQNLKFLTSWLVSKLSLFKRWLHQPCPSVWD
jgi:hypothetical protein